MKTPSAGMGRLILLLGVLFVFTIGYLALNTIRSPQATEPVPWWSEAQIKELIEGSSLALPDRAGDQSAKSLTIHREQVESLKIEPQGVGPEGKAAAQVTFVVNLDGGRYAVQGYVSIHDSDGDYYPIVNLGKGWSVTKE